ncbi:conserved hypothetical protein [Xenorhabdus nematophila F1]|uniref:Uncharacterized protein n=1 Tax=Xenorhabdus nematophila (strain ATCC 19061 / DSM 3370 / CCUG 14189 / LMG 1036 / NCIMB 9965 / AN6) TaxID=406817 RepID=D3VHA3_XENNA|nr:hypothetical protein; putative exported protein [Xenorhabdus nematophila ATCC 19061]CCW32587.1 conserved hypothetical protein [Xenorhabdus nematophila F1]CEE94711.1 hypothetical protein; putative exported protein [Xenorhabdus nematophila str. Anatoliense]
MAGNILVPKPATGITAFLTFLVTADITLVSYRHVITEKSYTD